MLSPPPSSNPPVYKDHTILSPAFFRPLIDFLAWWSATVWFSVTSIGFLYWQAYPHLTSSLMVGSARAHGMKKDRTTQPKNPHGKQSGAGGKAGGKTTKKGAAKAAKAD